MLQDIRAAIAPVSSALASDGYLRRGTSIFSVRMNPHSSVRPARAGQAGRSYDAKFRMHNDGRTQPMQNDEVSMDGVTWWTVWRVLPSPLETHSFLECMAPPSDIVVPIVTTKTPDGMGGWNEEETQRPDLAFAGKLSNVSTDHLLTQQSEGTMNRVALGYWEASANLRPGMRVVVRSSPYTVMAIDTDDENPAWGRAVLARED